MRLIPAGLPHVPSLAAKMRDADKLEVGALGRTPENALRSGLAASLWALTALVDDEPHAMLGVSPVSMIEGVGCPWMLGSERIYDHARDLVRHGPALIGEMSAGFERLENVVHVENHRALRFLRHFGFTIADEQEDHGGLMFVRFEYVQPGSGTHGSVGGSEHGGPVPARLLRLAGSA